MLPLEDIKILDTTLYLPGPFCSMWLGDMGADIIKIEETNSRGVEMFKAFSQSYQQMDEEKKQDIIDAYNLMNRNKRSICINLKSKEGQDVFYRLAETADVVLREGRPGVSERLGIDYEILKKINPRIIQCEISAFGQTGPYSNIPAHDPNIIGLAGILGITGTNDGSYVLPGVPIGDLFAGMQAVVGILVALQARQKTGQGQFIDVSMYNGLLYLLAARHGQLYFSTGTQPKAGERPAHVYETSDGKHLVIAPPEPWMWEKLCHSLGTEEFIEYREKAMAGPVDDPICREVCSRFAQIFRTKTRDEWFQILAFEVNTCATPVYESFEEVFSDPHAQYQKMIVELEHASLGNVKQIGVPIKLSDTPGSVRTLPPKPGQHTEEVLISAGYSKSRIEGLRKKGAIA
jgi:crotonobetainyl-CoA:carnitine CoA-transferase CaiB-like acyl-CoA transferase